MGRRSGLDPVPVQVIGTVRSRASRFTRRLKRNGESTWVNRRKNTGQGIRIAIDTGWRQRLVQGLRW